MEQTTMPRGVRRQQELKQQLLEDLLKNILQYDKNEVEKYEPEWKAAKIKELRAIWYKECENWNRLNKTFRLEYDAFDKSLAYYREMVKQQAISLAFADWKQPFWRKLWYKIRYRKSWANQLKLYFAENVYEKS